MQNHKWPYETFEAELDFWRAEVHRRLAARPDPQPRLAHKAEALAEFTQRRIALLKQATPHCRPFAANELKDLVGHMTILAAEAIGDERPAAYAV